MDLDETLKRIRERAEQREQLRTALPCFPHRDDEAAASACEAVRAFDACEFAKEPPCCPRRRLLDAYDSVRDRLVKARVPEREARLLRDAAARRQPLQETDALRVVRALLKRQRLVVDLAGGISQTLDADVVLIVLGGPRGVGKTVAACYALAREGGMYTTAYGFMRAGGIDLDEAKAARVLVVDQLGRENIGASDFGLSQLEEVLDARYAALRLTVLACNLERAQFVERYQGIIEDRLVGGGAFVPLTGSSLRHGAAS